MATNDDLTNVLDGTLDLMYDLTCFIDSHVHHDNSAWLDGIGHKIDIMRGRLEEIE